MANDAQPGPHREPRPGDHDRDHEESRPNPDPRARRLDPGGPELLGLLLDDYGSSIYRVAFGVLGDAGLAEDVVQETVLRAWQAMGEFRGESALRTWILRIAHNVAVSTARRRRDRPAYASDAVVELSTRRDERPAADVEREVGARLAVDELWRALGELDEPSRAVLVLRELEHLSYEEIAVMLGVPLPTVKTRLFRARRVLAARLAERPSGPPVARRRRGA